VRHLHATCSILPSAVSLTVLALAMLVGGLRAESLPPAEPAIGFFTNVATRLLRAEGLPTPDRIQLWPTNEYSPAVHRLLQLTANLHAAATNGPVAGYPWLPPVFRPLFTNTGDAVFINGYVEEAGTGVLHAAVRDLENDADRAALQPMDLVQGVPLVLGARKGLPNFNEFTLQTLVQAQRKLELRRTNLWSWPGETNELDFLAISNLFGLEAWNAYATAYPRALELRFHIAVDCVLTNEAGLVWRTNFTHPADGSLWQVLPSIAALGWPGSPSDLLRYSVNSTNAFQIPAVGGLTTLPLASYLHDATGGGHLADAQTAFPRTRTYPLPQLWLAVSARVRFALVDLAEQRLVDFVNLHRLERTVDLGATLLAPGASYEPNVVAIAWLTNRLGGNAVSQPTQGIVEQLNVALGNHQTGLSEWLSYGGSGANIRDKERAIDEFRVFCGLSPISYQGQLNPPVVTNLALLTPFNPLRKVSLTLSWQANDPLLHYLPSDFSALSLTNKVEYVTPPTQPPSQLLANVGRLNQRTRPWGGNPAVAVDVERYSPALKDPLVWRADDWDFPTNAPLSLATLSRVHRGTPWQTVSLKSASPDQAAWQQWTGIADESVAALTHPGRDARLAELWLAWTHTNYDGLLSVNERDPARWLAALDGLVVLTNVLPDAALANNPFLRAQFESLALSADSPQAATLAEAVVAQRQLASGGVFGSLGAVLATPALSLDSPWLNPSSIQLQRGLTDAAYEAIPVQLLPRLRPDLLQLERLASGEFRLTVGGFPGAACVIESTSDLRHWQPCLGGRLDAGIQHWTFSAGEGPRFFRCRATP
jgi:hypothetical protein